MIKNQRATKQKAKILELLKSVDHHPTADWLYQEARKAIPGLSLGTVYRNLNQLKENGEIQEMNLNNSQTRFDHIPENHYHFHCTNCGLISDMPMVIIKSIDKKARAFSKKNITGHRLDFFGECQDCVTVD